MLSERRWRSPRGYVGTRECMRRSLPGSAFPGRAWERGDAGEAPKDQANLAIGGLGNLELRAATVRIVLAVRTVSKQCCLSDYCCPHEKCCFPPAKHSSCLLNSVFIRPSHFGPCQLGWRAELRLGCWMLTLLSSPNDHASILYAANGHVFQQQRDCR
jgi:hypothetical protein